MIAPNQNTVFSLKHLSILNILGDHAASFLQGQLSCHMDEVKTNQIRQSAFCNLKGRILALPDVLKFHEIFRLILPCDLLEKTQKSLSKTAALSRVALEVDSDYHLFGFYLRDINQALPLEGEWPKEKYAVLLSNHNAAYYLGDNCYILLIHKNYLAKINATEDASAWHTLRLHYGEVQIHPESRGLFLPHRLGLHLSGHIHFNKGCYKGQEIIARMHYKAKHKHAFQVFQIQSQNKPRPGTELINLDTKTTIGEVIDVAKLSQAQFLIGASVLQDCDIKSTNFGVAD